MAKRNKRIKPNPSGDIVLDDSSSSPRGIEELTFKKISEGEVTIRVLVADLARELGYSSDRVISRLIQLKSNGKIKLVEKSKSRSLAGYAFSANSLWFWTALIATGLSILSVFISSGAALYARYVLGGALILFLPGYSLVEFLFAKKEDMEDGLTRIALSIGLSLALVPLLGLLLNYTPFGIRFFPIVITLGLFTFVFLLLGLAKKRGYYKVHYGLI